MAHAVHGYVGKCSNVHGHSYRLEVSVASKETSAGFIPAPGFIIDFKDLKRIVQESVIEKLDHSLVLSSAFIEKRKEFFSLPNLLTWDFEPTAENILLFARNNISDRLPQGVHLVKLKLYETADSFAEWTEDKL